MVLIFNVHRFTEQMVDTIDDLSAMAVTNHNKLLIAQSDYTIEVRDLLSEEKSPLFSFPTVDRVQSLTHCASGNYVATLEGKQTLQKSDVLIARVYVNWEADFVINECKKSTKFVKRFMRARIGGVVTPSSTKTDEDYLDMIEIPVSYSVASLITCCQKTGRLLVVSGSTVYLFEKVYLRGHNGKSPFFMDFVPLTQIFQLSFEPVSVTICENIITAHSHKMVSVFRLKKTLIKEEVTTSSKKDKPLFIKDINLGDNFSTTSPALIENGAINVTNLISTLKLNDEMKYFESLKEILSPHSFPLTVHLKYVNDSISNTTRTPFVVLPRRSHCEMKNGKVEDNYVETHSSNKEMTVVAESLLALQISDPNDTVIKTALQVLSHNTSTSSKSGSNSEQFCVGSEQFVCLNFIVITDQEGFLFYMSADKLQQGLQLVAFFHFTSPTISVTFESCFLHVLTKIGVETFNMPTLRCMVFDEEPILAECTERIVIFGLTAFIGVLDFALSEDCLTVFTTSVDGKKGKESLPWTVYSLKLPKIYESFKDVEELCWKFWKENNEFSRNLETEGYLMMQMALNFHLSIPNNNEMKAVVDHFILFTKKLIKHYFETKILEDTKIGTSILLASDINPSEIIKELDNEDKRYTPHIMYMVKKWMIKNYQSISSSDLDWLIHILESNNEIPLLSKFLLSNERICRSDGHKVIPIFTRYVNQSQEPDMPVLFVLCILYSQQSLQNEATDVLNMIKNMKRFESDFITIAINNYTFLFERNNEEQINFSEFTSHLIENLPLEISEIFTKLMKKNIFDLADIVQMLLKLFPCQVSMEKGHFVLQIFLESVFAHKIITDVNDPGVDNCLKILVRSYLTQLRAKSKTNDSKVTHKIIFSNKLPEYISCLPFVENCNYVALRKLQDLVWSKMLSEEAIKEIVEALPSIELKLNISAMRGNADFVKELIKHNFTRAIFPYAKVNINGVKKWRDLIILIQNRMAELRNIEHDVSDYEEIYDQILEYLATIMTPIQLNAVLEPILPHKDETYWKYIMKAQQISYANDVKELIMNTSQQLLYSNSLY